MHIAKNKKKHMSRPPRTSSTFTRCVFHPPFLARRFGVFPILRIHLASVSPNRTHGNPEKNPKYLITRSPTYTTGSVSKVPFNSWMEEASALFFFEGVCVLQRQMLHAWLSSLFQAIKPWSRRNPEVAVNGICFFSAFLNDSFGKSVLQLHMKVLIKIWELANLRHFWRAFKLSRLQEPVELFSQLGTSETWPSATLRQKWLNEKKHHSPTLIQKAVLSSISNICLLVPLLLYLCFLWTSYSTS